MSLRREDGLKTSSFSAFGYSRPLNDVGGDYFACLPLDEDSIGVVICDVTGHDAASAIPVEKARRALAARHGVGHEPVEVLSIARAALPAAGERLLLMSCFCARLDARAGSLRYASAGHPFPCLYRSQERRLERLPSLDPILGAVDREPARFRETAMAWESGDVLVLFTDGLTEARDGSGTPLAEDRIEACVRANASRSPEVICRELLGAGLRHAAGTGFADDITIAVVKGVRVRSTH